MPDFVERIDRARDWTSGLSLGVAVISLYFVLVACVFIGFASYIVRSEWEHRLANSSNPSAVQEVDTLVHLLVMERDLQQELSSARTAVRLADANIVEAKERVAKVDLFLAEVTEREEAQAYAALTAFRQVEAVMERSDAEKIRVVVQDNSKTVAHRGRTVMKQISSVQFGPSTDHARLDAFDQQLHLLVEKFKAIDLDAQVARADRARAAEALEIALVERSPARKAETELERRLQQVREALPPDSRDRARLAVLAEIPGGWLFIDFVQMPTIFLTLIVTIAAGGLGSVVSFSRRFNQNDLDGRDASSRRLFVNLGEGVAAAIAIFLFSGAGLLAMSAGPNTGGEQVDLSPYAVAFVAFLSGFMAEDAFALIQRTGKRLFNQDAPEPTG